MTIAIRRGPQKIQEYGPKIFLVGQIMFTFPCKTPIDSIFCENKALNKQINLRSHRKSHTFQHKEQHRTWTKELKWEQKKNTQFHCYHCLPSFIRIISFENRFFVLVNTIVELFALSHRLWPQNKRKDFLWQNKNADAGKKNSFFYSIFISFFTFGDTK